MSGTGTRPGSRTSAATNSPASRSRPPSSRQGRANGGSARPPCTTASGRADGAGQQDGERPRRRRRRRGRPRQDQPRGARRGADQQRGDRRGRVGVEQRARRPEPDQPGSYAGTCRLCAAWNTTAPASSAASPRSTGDDVPPAAPSRRLRRHRRPEPQRHHPGERTSGESWSRFAATSHSTPTPANAAPSASSSRASGRRLPRLVAGPDAGRGRGVEPALRLPVRELALQPRQGPCRHPPEHPFLRLRHAPRLLLRDAPVLSSAAHPGPADWRGDTPPSARPRRRRPRAARPHGVRRRQPRPDAPAPAAAPAATVSPLPVAPTTAAARTPDAPAAAPSVAAAPSGPAPVTPSRPAAAPVRRRRPAPAGRRRPPAQAAPAGLPPPPPGRPGPAATPTTAGARSPPAPRRARCRAPRP